MAEVTVEATAVSFRKGSHEDVQLFKGLEGEMVVDLDDHAVVVCDGGKRGGYPMARADFSNTDTKWLAEPNQVPYHSGKNLSYFDFTNSNVRYLMNGTVIAPSTEQPDDPYTGKALMAWDLSNLHTNFTNADSVAYTLRTDYHLAAANLSNYERIPQDMSVEERRIVADGIEADYYLSDCDARNMFTTQLAEGVEGTVIVDPDTGEFIENTVPTNRDPLYYGKNLAYSDTSNVNTSDLVDPEIHTGKDPVTLEDNGDKPLAYSDFSNVDLATTLHDYEILEHKVEHINSSTINHVYYPTTQALTNYTAQAMADTSATRALDNITSWKVAGLPSDYHEYTPIMTPSSGGSGYQVGDTLSFKVVPTGGTVQDTITLRYDVTEVENGAVTAIEFSADSDPLTFEVASPIYVQDNTTSSAIISKASYYLTTDEFPSVSYVGGDLLKTDLTNVSEALNILKVAPVTETAGSLRIDLNHAKSQVYPITIRDGVTDVSFTLIFPDEFDENAKNAYVYELHVTVGETLPNITWLIGTPSGTVDPTIPFRWIQYIPSPVDINKTALYVLRQQQGQVIANYAGSY